MDATIQASALDALDAHGLAGDDLALEKALWLHATLKDFSSDLRAACGSFQALALGLQNTRDKCVTYLESNVRRSAAFGEGIQIGDLDKILTVIMATGIRYTAEVPSRYSPLQTASGGGTLERVDRGDEQPLADTPSPS
ncbi:hypothetical protein VTJ04DRAFT_10701 [Mycothermus thermophilus]|uniref:uncharacterized protein n=1 Tax=Humicola insolens TaxID=85995 RepID=UPI0037432B36